MQPCHELHDTPYAPAISRTRDQATSTHEKDLNIASVA